MRRRRAITLGERQHMPVLMAFVPTLRLAIEACVSLALVQPLAQRG